MNYQSLAIFISCCSVVCIVCVAVLIFNEVQRRRLKQKDLDYELLIQRLLDGLNERQSAGRRDRAELKAELEDKLNATRH